MDSVRGWSHETLGDYRLISRLGEGSGGVVFRAEHHETGAVVAIKTALRPRQRNLASIRHEMHMLRQIDHPGIVRVIESGIVQGRPWYAMELLEGHTLADLIWSIHHHQRESISGEGLTIGSLPERGLQEMLGQTARVDEVAAITTGDFSIDDIEALDSLGRSLDQGALLTIVHRLCSPLAFLHGHGIVHRDIKPSNIFMLDDQRPVLVDFGIVSRASDTWGRALVERTEAAQGTPAYMAPEQIMGEEVDARADLYALGCVMYEALTGQPPFWGAQIIEVFRQHLTAPPPPPSTLNPEISPSLDALILKLLSKSPGERFGYAEDVARALDRMEITPETSTSRQRPRPYLYRAPLVQREALLARFEARLLGIQKGRGGGALVRGDAGLGKSALANAIAAQARKLKLHVIVGGGVGLGVNTRRSTSLKAPPLHPLRGLLQAFADLCLASDQAATAIFGDAIRLFGPFDPALASLLDVAAQPQAPLPPEAMLARLTEAFQEVLRRFCEQQPTLLVIDDLQWADALTLALLGSLDDDFFADCRVFLLMTSRPEYEVPGLDARQRLEVIDLEPLDAAGVRTIIREMLALEQPPPSPLVDAFTARSQGNPMLVSEFLYAALDQGLITRPEGRWQLAAEDTVAALPDSPFEFVLRRVEALDSRAKRLLKTASVLGPSFDHALLWAVCGNTARDENQLEALGLLLRLQLIESQSDDTLRFVHNPIQAAIYERLPDVDLIALHARAARGIEALERDGDRVEEHYATLARHWRLARHEENARRYAILAARHALSCASYADAVTFFVEALANLRGLSTLEHARLERELAEALLGQNRMQDARRHLERALGLLGERVPQTPAALGLGLAREVARQTWHRVARRRFGEGSSSVSCEEAASCFDLLQIAVRASGDALLILFTALRSLNLAEVTARPDLMATGYALNQVMVATIPLAGLARRYGELATSAMEQTDDAQVHSWVHHMAAVTAMAQGDWGEALRCAEEAAAIAEAIGFRRRWEETSICVLHALYSLGDVQAANVRAAAIVRSAKGRAPRHALWATTAQGFFAIEREEAARARGFLEEASHIARQDGVEPLDLLIRDALAAQIALHTGDLKLAAMHATEVLVALEALPPVIFEVCNTVISVQEALVRAYIATRSSQTPKGDPEAHRVAQRACKVAAAFTRAFEMQRPLALFWSGLLSWSRGRRPTATKRWRSALALAEKHQNIQAQVAAHAGLARADSSARALHESRKKALAEASDISAERYDFFERLSAS